MSTNPNTQALADIAAANKILSRLCDKGLVSMSIPVRDSDEDMILSRVIALASRLQEKEGQPALSDKVDSFRQLLAVEISATIDVSGDIARQEAQIDLADHLLVKFNELFPEAS